MRFNQETREIFLYDDIGPTWAGMAGADGLLEAVEAFGKTSPIHLRINSYGGAVDEALSMVAILKRHDGPIEVSVDAIAASAASIFPAIWPSTISPHGRVMIHKPWGAAIGNADDMRKTAEVLDLYENSVSGYYAKAMGLSAANVEQLLAAETWYGAESAVESGLVDSIGEETDVQASKIDPGRFMRTPAELVSNSVESFQNRLYAAHVKQRLNELRIRAKRK